MQKTGVQSLGREDPLEEGMTTHSSVLAWRIPMDRGARWATVMGSQRVGHDWSHWACMQERSSLMQGPCCGRYSACGCSVVQAEASLLAHLEQGHWVLGGIQVVTLPCFVLMTLSYCSDRCLPRCSHLWFCHLSFSTPSCFHDCSFFFCSSFLGLFKHFMTAWFIII